MHAVPYKIQIYPILYGFVALAVMGSVSVQQTWAQTNPAGKSLLVAEVIDETGDDEWNSLLIGQGIANLLEQALLETGRYRLLEDDPEVRAAINRLPADGWRAGAAPKAKRRTFADPANVESDVTAHAIVKKPRKSRTKVGFGPFSSVRTKVRIKIEVSLEEKGRPTRSAAGVGEGVTRAKAAIFQIRDDRIHFEETSVGRAVQTAIRKAVTKLHNNRRGSPR